MNNFNDILRKGAILSSGTIDDFNSMTIGWGASGVVYREDVFICFVKKNRYTYEFTSKFDHFVISFFSDEYKNVLAYMGTKSGRDNDKVNDLGLHPFDIDGVGVGFKEAYANILCKVIYFDEMNLDNLGEEIVNRYYTVDPPHVMYIGKIEKVIND